MTVKRAVTIEHEAESCDAHPPITRIGRWVGEVVIEAASSG
jgi:hypothetical protein